MTYTINLEVRENGEKDFALCLVQYGEQVPHVVELQSGYQSPAEALSALLTCLQFSPPDLTVYDEALSQVSQILDGINALNDAMTQVGERLNVLEEWMEANTAAQPQRTSNLLPPRRATQPPEPARVPPAIRRPAANQDIGIRTHAGLVGGGAFRPGQGGNTPEGED